MGVPAGSWTTIVCGIRSVIRRSSRSSSRSFASVSLRVSISVHVPYHLTILPASSRSGSTLMRNQRNTPSWQRRPVASVFFQGFPNGIFQFPICTHHQPIHRNAYVALLIRRQFSRDVFEEDEGAPLHQEFA